MFGTVLLGALIAAAPLDSRAAERAMELSLEAELAGDPEGARKALEARIAAASEPGEAVGRAMLERWVAGSEARARGFSAAATAAEAVEGWDRMASAPVDLRDRAWRHLVERSPPLAEALRPVRVEVDRTSGLAAATVRAAMERALESRGVGRSPAGLELAARFEADRGERVGGWVRVRAELGAVLTSTGTESTEALVLFARSRTERRRDSTAAKQAVLRRLTVDAAEAVRFALRRRAIGVTLR